MVLLLEQGRKIAASRNRFLLAFSSLQVKPSPAHGFEVILGRLV
jgi:hypothetical protein